MLRFALPTAAALLLACVAVVPAHAQGEKQPWQVTLTRSQNQPGATRIHMDLPLPPPGRLLTLRGISVRVGPHASAYGKVHRCEIESEHPRLPGTPSGDERTRILLPLPTYLGNDVRTYAIPFTAVELYAEYVTGSRNLLRVSCDTESVGFNDKFEVTAVGHTTTK